MLGGRLAVFLSLSTLSACAVHPSLPPSLPVPPAPSQPAERIPVSIRTYWPNLVAVADAAIPKCDDDTCPGTGESENLIIHREDDWEPQGRWLGREFGIKGSVWRREPLVASISGNQISASLRLLYRLRLGLRLIGWREVGNCGYDDAPREVTARLDGEMRLAPDWYVNPTLVADVTPESLCTVTFFNFNISDSLASSMEETLQKEADDAGSRIRKITNVRDRAAAVWAGLNEPIAIGARTWLLFNPVSAAAGRPRITQDGQYVSLPVALEASPKIVVGARPAPGQTPLPLLSAGELSPDFSLNIRGLLTYAHASAALTEALRAKEFSPWASWPFNLLRFRVQSATVAGSGPKVIIALEIQGFLRGTLYLLGTPKFEPRGGGVAGGYLSIRDIGYTIETRSLLARLGNSIFGSRIQRALESAARWDVSEQLQAGLGDLERALNRDLSPQARMLGRLSNFGPGSVRVGPDGLEAWYRVGGKVEVVLSPF